MRLTDQADGYVIADAIRLVPPGAPPNSATWSFATTPDEYEVQARWTAHPNRATNAQYAIGHAAGTATVAVNQQLDGGTWHSLGTYTFGSMATIQLTDQANGYVIADAVKLVHTAPATAGIYYVHADHLGTPRKITRPSDNQVIWSWNGAPFGETPANEDPDGDGVRFEFNPRFPGQYFDVEMGKHYNYFRDYDPGTGRYIESDPIGLAAGINTFAYAGNDPNSQIDPLGLANGPAVGWLSGPSPFDTCQYYNQQCSKTGCRYYCFAGPAICRTADINPLFRRDPTVTGNSLQCVRKCLVREDAKAHERRKQKSQCDNGCLTDKEIDDYHIQCFTECGVNPQVYPGVGILN